MTVDPTSRTSRYPEMRQTQHRAEWIRQAVALVSALALLFHIGVMAAGAGRLPDVVTGSAQALAHAHHAASAAEHEPDLPKGRAEHLPPCCILSVYPGLPTPPTGHTLVVRPRPEATVLVYRRVEPMSALNLAQFSPVGARAPPVPV